MKNTVKKIILTYWIHLVVLVAAMGFGGWMAIHANQDINFDLLNYHYANPHLFLHDRLEHDIAVGELQSYSNPLPDIPGYLLINTFRPRVAALGLGMIQGINAFLVFELALLMLPRARIRQRWRILAAAFIGGVSFLGAASLSEVGNTMGDNITSLFVLSGLWLLLYSLGGSVSKRFDPRTFRLAAYLVAGVGAGLKLTNLIYVIGLLAAGLLIEGGWLKRLRESILHGLAVVVGMLVSGGFWYAKLWMLFKNPIFPFYNGIFGSPYYPAVNFEDSRWLPQTVEYALFAPYYYMTRQSLASELPFKDPRLAVVYSALIVVIAYFAVRKWIFALRPGLPRWSRAHTAFWLFVVVSFGVWVSKFTIYRYLLPVELLAVLALATVVYSMIPHFWRATAAVAIISIVLARLTVPIDWGRIPWQSTYFGISKATFAHLENGTILIAGRAPFGFMVPYFPESSRTIRIESDLTSPSTGTDAMQAKMKQAIDARMQQNSKFYALRADEEQVAAEKAFGSFGFRSQKCQLIPEFSRQHHQLKLRLCELEKI